MLAVSAIITKDMQDYLLGMYKNQDFSFPTIDIKKSAIPLPCLKFYSSLYIPFHPEATQIHFMSHTKDHCNPWNMWKDRFLQKKREFSTQNH